MGPGRGNKVPVRYWAGAAIVGILVLGILWFQHQARRGDRELPVYVTGAERMLAGEEIYRGGADAKPFTYPPFFAVPFVPFTWLSEKARVGLWFSINFGVLLLCLWRVHTWTRELRVGDGPPFQVFWIPTLLLAGRHLFSVFENQSHDLLILGLLVLCAEAWRKGRDFAAGAWAGVGAACKATPLLFLSVPLLRARWSGVVGVVAAAMLFSLVPDLFFPRDDMGYWTVAWYEKNLRALDVGGTAAAAGAWNSHSVLNQSLSGAVARLLSPPVHTDSPFVVQGAMLFDAGPEGTKAVTLGLQVLVLLGIAAAVWLCGRRGEKDRGGPDPVLRWGEVGLVACGMVLLSPMSSKSHFCVLLLPMALAVAWYLYRGRDRLLLWLLVLAFALGTATTKGIWGRELGNRLLAFGVVTWHTVVVMAACARVTWLARRCQP